MNNRKIEIFHKGLDLALIQISWWVAYYIRFSTTLMPSSGNPYLMRYVKFSLLLLAVSYYFFSQAGLYSSRRIRPLYEEFYSVIKANLVSFTFFVFAGFFLTENRLSRIFIISYLLISTAMLILSKISIRAHLKYSYQKGYGVRGAFLIGNSPKLQEYAKQIETHPEMGLKIVSWVKDDSAIQALSLNDIEATNPSTVVFGHQGQSSNQLISDLNNLLVEVMVLPDLSHSYVGYQIVDYSGIPAILINEPNLSNRSVILKRLFDISTSGLGLLVISPFLILIAAIIKLTSKGPIFYSQVRMGLDGKEFKMFKFRSMRTDSSNKETWTVKDDPRVTAIGKIIRKTSIDELPQLLNVFFGDMSMVGPRPERPMYVHQFKKDIPTYMLRHKMKAGITGWAQINGWRGDTSIEKRIECDLYYIKHWSIWFDVWIIFMTFWKGFINKNAY